MIKRILSLATLSLLLSINVMAQDNPPKEVFEACDNKKVGDDCEVETEYIFYESTCETEKNAGKKVLMCIIPE